MIRNSRSDLENSRESRVKFLEFLIQGRIEDKFTKIKFPLYTSEKKVKGILKLSKDFLAIAPKAWSIQEKLDKLDISKIKNFCTSKNTIKKTKR